MAKENLGKYWDVSWNPLVIKGGGYHCTKISPGCLNCWAEGYNLRFHNKTPYDNSDVEFVLNEKVLARPLRWQKPRTIFVCDLCDLFHEKVPFEFQVDVVNIAYEADCHKHLFLTKRAKELLLFSRRLQNSKYNIPFGESMYFGTTICNQAEKPKGDILRTIPAAERWWSIEPLLENLGYLNLEGVDWLVVGCESLPGGKAGRFQDGYDEAALSVIQQCQAAGVKVYHKQRPVNGRVSHDMAEWPEELRVRDGF